MNHQTKPPHERSVFQALEQAWKEQLHMVPCVLSLRSLPDPSWPFLVSGGLNGFVQYLEGYRMPAAQIGRMRQEMDLDPAFLEVVRECRGEVNVLGIAEGELFGTGLPVLELHGTVLDCMVLRTKADQMVRLGITTATATSLLRIHYPDKDFTYSTVTTPTNEERRVQESAARVAAWTEPTPDTESSALVWKNPRIAPTLPDAQDGRIALDLNTLVSAGPTLEWQLWSTPQCSAPWCSSTAMSISSGPTHVYRTLNDDGMYIVDKIVPRGTPIAEGSRSILQRFADRGRPCRPLPDTARSRIMGDRSREEIGDLQSLVNGNRVLSVQEIAISAS
ncbi:MAG: hypothetical protein CMH54_04145 [Myxococcales bacterium]|nr:hypothetical protein [Myxococcales bacterium]